MTKANHRSQTTAGRRVPAAVLVSQTTLNQATSALRNLPEKPREIWSLREAIGVMREVISTALNKGYSHEEVAKLLSQTGVDIRPSSLKYYLAAVKRNQDQPTRTRVRRSFRGANLSAMDADAMDADATDEMDLDMLETENEFSAIENGFNPSLDLDEEEPIDAEDDADPLTNATAPQTAASAKKARSDSDQGTKMAAKANSTSRRRSTETKASSSQPERRRKRARSKDMLN
jgi:hypothetical protein